jgi:glutamate-5-semialdehyde dehydrogenase
MTLEATVRQDDLKSQMEALGQAARAAAEKLALAAPESKDRALFAAAEALRGSKDAILAANARDMAGGRAKGLSAALLDRLELNPERIEAMASGLEAIAGFPDPIGKTLAAWERPNGLKIAQIGRAHV